MSDCIFCKIINKTIPAYPVYEDDHTLAFLDAFPGTKGHTLIIPKAHYQDIFDTPDEVYQQILSTALKVSKALKIALNPDGLNLMQHSGKASGQTVFHIHVHLFPRWEGDNALGGWHPEQGKPEIFEQLQRDIKAQL